MRYQVEAYENSEIPNPMWLRCGEFETADEAIRCAESIIRKSLQGLADANRRTGPLTGAALFSAYLCYGEVPSIFGEPKVLFQAYDVVERIVREMTGDAAWVRTTADRE